MRISDTPCLVSASNGLVHFECAGTTASFEPDAAARAGGSLIERAKSARLDAMVRTGEQLIRSAAEAMRQRAALIPPLSAAA